MTGERLNADVDRYQQAAATGPPPPIVSDPLITGVSPIEQLLRALGLAANAADPRDGADSVEDHDRRAAMAAEAAEKFTDQDDAAAAELGGVAGQDPSAAMLQQAPQAVSAIAAAVSGALGAALQPLTQFPQQVAQGAQQAMQTGMGMFAQSSAGYAPSIESDPAWTDDLFFDAGHAPADVGAGTGEPAGGWSGGAGGATSPGGTVPTATLGPPPIPSAGTVPSAAPPRPVPAASPAAAPATGGAGLTGMPMVPPGAVGAAANADKESKTPSKRVSVPPVRNGAPVQGRLTAPPSLPAVTKKVEARPVAVRRTVRTDDGAQESS
ncbi:hypothetical protein [Mycolicibacterium sp.]|uniref:hypothetical protein n=1 Tax=Mycolicibacterium sp. TaxID=2320850 RepID=UPI0025EF16DA|nr:hypothetical protein [Mycolicibacterium sp.]MCB9410568.1 hypothetical protein [Mycolicibacterium sp.]